MKLDVMKIQSDLHKFVTAGEGKLEFLANAVGLSVDQTSRMINTAFGTSGSVVSTLLRLHQCMQEALVKELESRRESMLEEINDFTKYNPLAYFDLSKKTGMDSKEIIKLLKFPEPDDDILKIRDIYEAYEEIKKEIQNAVNLAYATAKGIETELAVNKENNSKTM